VLIFIYIAIGSISHALLILANLSFALIGRAAAIVITGATLSVGSIVVFVTLFGITVRNSIMLLSPYIFSRSRREKLASGNSHTRRPGMMAVNFNDRAGNSILARQKPYLLLPLRPYGLAV
jgi:Cu/Ag efflux pump CusA